MDNLTSLFAEFQFTTQEGYTENDPEMRNSSNRITILPKHIRLWKPTQGEQSHIRFLPQLDKPYFAEETRGHYKVGGGGHSFGCPNMKREECPMCDFARKKYIQANETDNEEEAKEIRAVAKEYNGVIYHYAYIIDRKHPDKGVQAYAMTQRAIETIRAQLTDDNGQAYSVDHPKLGFDIKFFLPKKEQFAMIEAVKVNREPSPVTFDPIKGVDVPERADGWVKFIKENPLSKIINFIPTEEIQKLAFGSVATTSTPSESSASTKTSSSNAVAPADSESAWGATAEEAFAQSLASTSTEKKEDELDFEAKMAEMQRKLSEAGG